jgi:hypothetical protein
LNFNCDLNREFSMKMIMIHRDDKDYGPYSIEEITGLLSQGVLTPDDLAWVEGGNEWVPLKDLLPPISRNVPTTAVVASPSEEKAPQTNSVGTKGYLIGAALLALLTLIVLAVVGEVKDTIAPFLALVNTKPAPLPSADDKSMATGTGNFFAVTMEMDGNSMSATMMTDDSHEAQLCDQVMGEIYSLATKNPSASDLKMTLQVVGKKEVTIQIEDMDAVRNYQDKQAYASSEHHGFVEGLLVSAGLIDESALASTPSAGDASGLIGNTYLYAATESPRLGVRFINDSQVDILSDGAKVGATCSYTIQGNTIIIPTSCSVLRLEMHGDQLMPEDMHYPLVKQ